MSSRRLIHSPLPGSRWQLRRPQLVPNSHHPQRAALGLWGLGMGSAAVEEDEKKEEERQVKPLNPGGFIPHTGVCRVEVLAVDGDQG